MTSLKSSLVAMLLVIVASAAPAQQTRLEWAEHIYYSILSKVRYPPEAATKRQQGQAVVEFRVAPTGEIMSRQILQSSGHAILDETALAAVDSAAPFPPFPPDMKNLTAQDLKLPIRFFDNRVVRLCPAISGCVRRHDASTPALQHGTKQRRA